MDIRLKDWLALEAKREEIDKACHGFTSLLADLVLKYTGEEERKLLFKLLSEVEDIAMISSCAPRSEWLGGDSTDPKNHALREPYIAGRHNIRRYFTAEELQEVNAECQGAAQWNFNPQRDTE